MYVRAHVFLLVFFVPLICFSQDPQLKLNKVKSPKETIKDVGDYNLIGPARPEYLKKLLPKYPRFFDAAYGWLDIDSIRSEEELFQIEDKNGYRLIDYLLFSGDITLLQQLHEKFPRFHVHPKFIQYEHDFLNLLSAGYPANSEYHDVFLEAFMNQVVDLLFDEEFFRVSLSVVKRDVEELTYNNMIYYYSSVRDTLLHNLALHTSARGYVTPFEKILRLQEKYMKRNNRIALEYRFFSSAIENCRSDILNIFTQEQFQTLYTLEAEYNPSLLHDAFKDCIYVPLINAFDRYAPEAFLLENKHGHTPPETALSGVRATVIGKGSLLEAFKIAEKNGFKLREIQRVLNRKGHFPLSWKLLFETYNQDTYRYEIKSLYEYFSIDPGELSESGQSYCEYILSGYFNPIKWKASLYYDLKHLKSISMHPLNVDLSRPNKNNETCLHLIFKFMYERDSFSENGDHYDNDIVDVIINLLSLQDGISSVDMYKEDEVGNTPKDYLNQISNQSLRETLTIRFLSHGIFEDR